MKLLKGQVNIVRAVKVALNHVGGALAARAKTLAQVLGLGEEPRLSRDLKRVLRTRHVTMYFSEGEPGRDILMHDAKRTALRAMKAGRLELHAVQGADHTFSQYAARREITQRLLEHFAARYSVRGTLQPAGARPQSFKAAA
jgi:hypothetical protein